MREPERLLFKGATDFERQLLEAVKNERPSAELQLRMQQGIGLSGGTAAPPALLAAKPSIGVALKGVGLKLGLGALATFGLVMAGVALEAQWGDSPSSGPASVAPSTATPAAPGVQLLPPEGPTVDEVERHRADVDPATLREEIELLDEARAAVALGEHERVADALKRYDARFPAGSLRREADILRSRALPLGHPPGSRGNGPTEFSRSRGKADPEAAFGR